MDAVYFYCDTCYRVDHNMVVCTTEIDYITLVGITDFEILKNIFYSNHVTYVDYDNTCNKCKIIDNLINHSRNFSRQIIIRQNALRIIRILIENHSYKNEFGLFRLYSNHSNTISQITRRGNYNCENIKTTEEFLDLIKPQSLINVLDCQKQSEVFKAIKKIKKYLDSKNLHIKAIEIEPTSHYFLVTKSSLVKPAINENYILTITNYIFTNNKQEWMKQILFKCP